MLQAGRHTHDKWSQTPSGKTASTVAQLQGANNARAFDPGRLARQMATNQLAKKFPRAIRGQGRERLMAKFRTDSLYQGTIKDNATAFAPPPEVDPAHRILGGALDVTSKGVGLTAGALGVLRDPDAPAVKALTGLESALGVAGDTIGGKSPGEPQPVQGEPSQPHIRSV